MGKHHHRPSPFLVVGLEQPGVSVRGNGGVGQQLRNQPVNVKLSETFKSLLTCYSRKCVADGTVCSHKSRVRGKISSLRMWNPPHSSLRRLWRTRIEDAERDGLGRTNRGSFGWCIEVVDRQFAVASANRVRTYSCKQVIKAESVKTYQHILGTMAQGGDVRGRPCFGFGGDGKDCEYLVARSKERKDHTFNDGHYVNRRRVPSYVFRIAESEGTRPLLRQHRGKFQGE